MPFDAVLVHAAFEQGQAREKIKNFGVSLGDDGTDRLFVAEGDIAVIVGARDAGHRFGFGKFVLKNGLVPPRERQIILISNGINPISIRIAIGHGILLIHIIANQDDEGNGNDETDGLDDGVEFVSGKEFDVT